MKSFLLCASLLAAAALAGPGQAAAAGDGGDSARVMASDAIAAGDTVYTTRVWRGEAGGDVAQRIVNGSDRMVTVTTPDLAWSRRIKPAQALFLDGASGDVFLVGIDRDGAQQQIVVTLIPGDVLHVGGPEQE